jgi:scyllo-inositol 2-dehydrogenase (NADP+)
MRNGGLVPDAFHVILAYDRLEAVLHASSLVRNPGPRYEVHGENGSFLKGGIDTQEAALKAGGRPGDLGWGIDPDDGQLTCGIGGLNVSARAMSVRGSYETYYAGLAGSIIDGSPLPVSAIEGRDVVRVIELVVESERTGRRIGWDEPVSINDSPLAAGSMTS